MLFQAASVDGAEDPAANWNLLTLVSRWGGQNKEGTSPRRPIDIEELIERYGKIFSKSPD